MHLIPERARERILDLAATQLPTGGAYHQYQPLTKRGNNDVGSGFNDDPHWLVLAVTAYIKEDGRLQSSSKNLSPTITSPAPRSRCMNICSAQSNTRSTVSDRNRTSAHRSRRLERLSQLELLLRYAGSILPDHDQQGRQSRGKRVHRGFVCAGGEGDGGARWQVESQKLASKEVERSTFDLRPSTFYLEQAAKMETVIWQHGWDGEWFRRAYDDFGHVLGSKENDGRTHLHRAAGHLRHGRSWRGKRSCGKSDGFRWRTSRHAAWHRPAPTCLHALLSASW